MPYRVKITKRSDNPGPLSASQSIEGRSHSLPKVGSIFAIVNDVSYFHTSTVKNVRYKNGNIIIQTLNSIYDVTILENDIE